MNSPEPEVLAFSASEIPELYDLKARGKWVLVKMLAKEEVIRGGIVLSQAQAKTQHGIVVDVDTSQVPDLVPGQMVVFTNFPNALDDVEELTGLRDLYLVREEEIYSRAVKITDPELIRQRLSEYNRKRDEAIAKQQDEDAAAQRLVEEREKQLREEVTAPRIIP